MTCYSIYDKDRRKIGVMCGKLGPHCAECGDVGINLCDFPVGNGKTCDRSICGYHSARVGIDLDYCPAHHTEWKSFRDSGGVKQELENVVPFKGA
ncbi:hypothetical protein SAMN03159304_01125 [Pseudomonas sp. NFACC24-1]|uniref:hypothetical protein n=1 Tax=Pseudomonas sp. NFACC24-1 TaxID=1566189 RepID=UPI0008EC2A0F|nr:hypothetical protein [Pseudomonas sp. NFACC24-1]SFN83418.1 hypothetical protein SAMN03159304_01125 [Pseudomonas sp. NFACC24-1]